MKKIVFLGALIAMISSAAYATHDDPIGIGENTENECNGGCSYSHVVCCYNERGSKWYGKNSGE